MGWRDDWGLVDVFSHYTCMCVTGVCVCMCIPQFIESAFRSGTTCVTLELLPLKVPHLQVLLANFS